MDVFAEPRVYGLSRNRLIYSIVGIIVVAVGSFLEIKQFSLGWLVLLILLALYLFLPFAYKLILSEDAISSVNLLRTATLEWNEVAEIKPHRRGLLLSNADGSIRVFINSQIDHYPELIKSIQQKRPDLWQSQALLDFHQNILESILMLVMSAVFLALIAQLLFQGDPLGDGTVPLLAMFAACAFTMWKGLSRIRGLSLENERLVIKYIFWQRHYLAQEVKSVGLQQEMNKNQVNYPVHIGLENGKVIKIESVKEGNPVLVHALEQWLQKHRTSIM